MEGMRSDMEGYIGLCYMRHVCAGICCDGESVIMVLINDIIIIMTMIMI